MVARWTTRDPLRIRGADTNAFAYCGNDSVNFVDPSGEDRLINPQPAGPNGPTITFINDDPNGPSTNLPVDDALADMIEAVAVRTGLSSNINSSIGGTHDPKSRHFQT